MASAQPSLKRPAAVSSPGRSVKVKTEPKSAVKAPDAPSLPEGGKGPEAPAGSVAGDSLPARGSDAKVLPPIPQKDAKLMAQKLGRLEKKRQNQNSRTSTPSAKHKLKKATFFTMSTCWILRSLPNK